jgi:hypothetical protein
MALAHLPAELICQVAESLPQHDRLNLRLVCRHVEHATFGLLKSQFREIGFMITTRSLEILRSISMHPELAGVVEHVWFNPDSFTHVTVSRRDDTGQDVDDVSAHRRESYLEPGKLPTPPVFTEFLHSQ